MVARFTGTKESALELINIAMGITPQPLQIERKTVDSKDDTNETAAGRLVNDELEMLREELSRLWAEIGQAKEEIQAKHSLKKDYQSAMEEIIKLQEQQQVLKYENENLKQSIRSERESNDGFKKEILDMRAESEKKQMDQIRHYVEQMLQVRMERWTQDSLRQEIEEQSERKIKGVQNNDSGQLMQESDLLRKKTNNDLEEQERQYRHEMEEQLVKETIESGKQEGRERLQKEQIETEKAEPSHKNDDEVVDNDNKGKRCEVQDNEGKSKVEAGEEEENGEDKTEGKESEEEEESRVGRDESGEKGVEEEESGEASGESNGEVGEEEEEGVEGGEAKESGDGEEGEESRKDKNKGGQTGEEEEESADEKCGEGKSREGSGEGSKEECEEEEGGEGGEVGGEGKESGERTKEQEGCKRDRKTKNSGEADDKGGKRDENEGEGEEGEGEGGEEEESGEGSGEGSGEKSEEEKWETERRKMEKEEDETNKAKVDSEQSKEEKSRPKQKEQLEQLGEHNPRNGGKRGVMALRMGLAEWLQREITRMNGLRVERMGGTMSTGREVRLRTASKPVNDEAFVAVIGVISSSMSYICRSKPGYDDNGVNEKHDSYIQPTTMYCPMVSAGDYEKSVTLVDVSGFMDNTFSQNKTTVSDTTDYLHTDCVLARKFSGLLFLHPISELLTKGPRDSSLFTQLEKFGCQVGRFVGTAGSSLGQINLVSSARQPPLDQSEVVDDQKSPQQTRVQLFVDTETDELRGKHHQPLVETKEIDPAQVEHGQEISEKVYTEEQTAADSENRESGESM